MAAMIAFPVSAQDLFDLYQNSVSKAPFVAFLARNSPGATGAPGHSFVGFGVELDNGLTVYENLLGFHPKGGGYEVVKAVFSSTSGELKSVIEDVAWDVELRVYPSDSQFQSAKSVVQTWMSDAPKYNLFAENGKNCSVFASEVAAAMGLNVPDGPGSKLPITFISEMKDIN
ncbi:hypothetical protein [Ruegeria sp. HKCCA5014]|uniref:hypothetical protein n=1 Tax=Ruegeria sp. HKCCA5014 TaxID=2682980 RepID=UPI001489171C|nr:hypothetical protein [Ruegeria sp. HKCCA5014]